MYYELVKDTLTNRGTIVAESLLRGGHTGEMYVSMFGFDSTILEWVKFQKTVAGFTGKYCCKYFYLDIDRSDLGEALDYARRWVLLLQSRLYVRPTELYICFSGNKGFHIGLNQAMFGGFGYDELLPSRIELLAAYLSAECYSIGIDEVVKTFKSEKHFHGLDMKIYNANRIFRATNSLNAKSGLYKIPILPDELFSWDIDTIKNLAKSPRNDYRLPVPVTHLPINKSLVDLWTSANAYRINEQVLSSRNTLAKGKESTEGIYEAFFGPVKEGSRNNDFFRQACMLFDLSKLTKNQVRTILDSFNAQSVPPLDSHEMETIVHSAFRRTAGNAKPELPTPTNEVETFAHWVDAWVDEETAEKKPLTLLLPELDALTDRNYRGKLICFAGGAGSMKSYFVQNVIRENVQKYSARCAYASMEMSKPETVRRFLDILYSPQDGKAASSVLSELVKRDKQLFYDSLSGDVQTWSNSLFLNSKSGVSAKDLSGWLDKIEAIYGSVSLLAVDGASMLQGASDDEIKAMSVNTKELKELANQRNIAVIVIFHTTKDVEPHFRPVIRKMRGSGKIIDNGDMFVGFSRLIDENKSTPEQVKYVSGYGHINFWNKRGNGKEIDLLFQADTVTAKISSTHRMPEEFPTYEAFCKRLTQKSAKTIKLEPKQNNILEKWESTDFENET